MTINPSAYQLKRYEGNPILSPKEGSSWESEVTTNPAAWYAAGLIDIMLVSLD